jgi:hypothetical protein
LGRFFFQGERMTAQPNPPQRLSEDEIERHYDYAVRTGHKWEIMALAELRWWRAQAQRCVKCNEPAETLALCPRHVEESIATILDR